MMMYRSITSEIEEALRQACSELEMKFDFGFDEAAAQIKEDLKIMLERHSTDDARIKSQGGTSAIKVDLYNGLLPHFQALEKAFGVEPTFQEETSEVQPINSPELAEDEEEFGYDLDLDKELEELISQQY